MQPVIIENPILNSPFEEPTRHFRFDDDNSITAEIVGFRRASSYFVPIAGPKKVGKQALLTDSIADEKKFESQHVNEIRAKVKKWRMSGWPDITPATRSLLEHWTDPTRSRRLFFCQIEALETLIYLTEAAKLTKYGDEQIEQRLREAAKNAGTSLFRMACKMATGSGKTVVMSMLIAWQVLNKRRNPKDNRFSDAFLVVAPGITIRDRLRVLFPSDDGNYYKELDVVPTELLPEIGTAKIVITNFHAFQQKEKGDAGGLTKRILTANKPGAFTESAEEMVNRVCRELGTHREILVINDEAHHCYRPKAPDPTERLVGDEKKGAAEQTEEARLWISGLEAVHDKVGVKAVFDLSATPFYLKGSGYPEGTLFPWVVSDFALIDAIESGIVKIPRVPVSDNAMAGEYPKYRNLWVHIREGLPKKGRGVDAVSGPPILPQELQGAMESLYGHYRRKYIEWEREQAANNPDAADTLCEQDELLAELNAALNTNWTAEDVPSPPLAGWTAARDVLEAWAKKAKTALEKWSENARRALRRWWELLAELGKNRRPDAHSTPPVFIVVCNNTAVSKLVFDYIGGHETEHQHPDGAPLVAPGHLEIFSNVRDQRWLSRPNTILVDSQQLESGENMSDDFKKLATHQIEEFKVEYRKRFPGRDTESLTDEDLMREVLNTVGKPGKLGEQIKCVVSVSMLTEGWDCNTVTHILGVRAFGTQLLCEQVVGRGLRRASYALNDSGHFDPEYADVYGVPFSFIPCAGLPEEGKEKKPVQKPGRVKAVPERLLALDDNKQPRSYLEVTFPRVLGYRYEVPADKLAAKFDSTSKVKLTTEDIPTRTENAPIVGETAIHTLDDLKGIRPQTVAFKLATHLQQRFFKDKVWLFPQLLGIVRTWLGDPDGDTPNVDYGDDTFSGLLLFAQKANEAAEKIHKAIVAGSGGEKRLRAELSAFDCTGSTSGVSYDTVKATWKTNPAKCHLNLVPQDSGWESQFAEKIEHMDELRAYVKNQNLGFKIAYTCEGRPGNYYPDYILKVDDGRGTADLLHLIVEITGEKKLEKEAKVTTARTLWVPAVNNEVVFGRWAFLEIDADNRHKAKDIIRKFLKNAIFGPI